MAMHLPISVNTNTNTKAARASETSFLRTPVTAPVIAYDHVADGEEHGTLQYNPRGTRTTEVTTLQTRGSVLFCVIVHVRAT